MSEEDTGIPVEVVGPDHPLHSLLEFTLQRHDPLATIDGGIHPAEREEES